MTENDLNNLATKRDLLELESKILNTLKKGFSRASTKQFYTVKEFAAATGLSYSTVLLYCNTGKLRARQEGNRSVWSIHRDELDTYFEQANNNPHWKR